MFRLLRTITVLGLFGAAPTVAVAWACALWTEPVIASRYGRASGADVAWWSAHAPPVYARPPAGYVLGATAFGISNRYLWADAEPSGRHPVFRRHLRIRSGWPMRSMEGAIWTDGKTQALLPVPPGWPLIPAGTVPLRPLWPGFLADTALVAAAGWLAGFGGRWLRARRRRRRSLCPCCGYPRGVSGRCTECGAALR